MQAHSVHDFVHDESGSGHIAGILHPRDEGIENHNVGQEDDDATHTADNAVDDEVFQGTVGHIGSAQLAQPPHGSIYPIHRVLADVEGAEEHQVHE